MAGTKAEDPGSSNWAFSQDIPDSWEDCELGTELSFGKPDSVELPVSTHVELNKGDNETDVAESWEDCDAEIPGRQTDRHEGDGYRPLQSPWCSDEHYPLGESSLAISDDFIDEEFDREVELAPEAGRETRYKDTASSDHQNLGNSYNGSNANQESETFGRHADSLDEEQDYSEDDEWWEIWSERDAEFYFHNKRTKQVVWNFPDDANVIRYGTGPDGGTPYYSPFYSKDFQAKVGAPTEREETKHSDHEFLTIPEFRRNDSRAASIATDVSFKEGVCQESFSFDGSSERDFAEFLDFVHDGEVCLNPRSSVSRPSVQAQPIAEKKAAAPSAPGSPRSHLQSNSTAQAMAKRQSSSSPPPLPTRRSTTSSINRPSSPPRVPSPDGRKKAPRALRAGRLPPPVTVTWGVPKSPLESLKNPFSRPASSEGPVLLNRESSSLTLKEDSIQEIVANVSLSLEAFPSFDLPQAQSSIGSTVSLSFRQQPPTPDNLKVFGKNCQPPKVPQSSEPTRKCP